MMYVLMLTFVIVGVEAVELKKESSGVTFPGKQATMNSSSSMTVSKPASSVLHCGIQCLTDGDCVAANYEDAGVCHMSAGGRICLEDNTHTTAILPESSSIANSLHMVGWWPLQEAYGGKDLSDHCNDIELNNVTFPDDGVTPWASPASDFNGTVESYGHIQHGHHLDVKSFSWMAKVYPHGRSMYDFMVNWKYNGASGVRIYLFEGHLRPLINFPGCPTHFTSHPTLIPLDAWHTVAVTYDFPTNTITVWLNGESHVSTKPACGTNIKTSPELYIGKRSDDRDEYTFRGRLSCMSLYSSLVDYDVMYAATMSHCGGE